MHLRMCISISFISMETSNKNNHSKSGYERAYFVSAVTRFIIIHLEMNNGNNISIYFEIGIIFVW